VVLHYACSENDADSHGAQHLSGNEGMGVAVSGRPQLNHGPLCAPMGFLGMGSVKWNETARAARMNVGPIHRIWCCPWMLHYLTV
jgi:hypothetical protein